MPFAPVHGELLIRHAQEQKERSNLPRGIFLLALTMLSARGCARLHREIAAGVSRVHEVANSQVLSLQADRATPFNQLTILTFK